MVKYIIDDLLYHRVRIKDIYGNVYEGEVVSFEYDLDIDDGCLEIDILPETPGIYYGIAENECESLEIID